MSRGVLGWDYPPGCSSVPGDEDVPCEVCGKNTDNCICPECPVCHQAGDPACYAEGGHGLVKNAEQEASYKEATDYAQNREEEERQYYDELAADEAAAALSIMEAKQ